MKELGLVLSRYQFKDIMRLADNFDRMKTNSQYRKYKPFVPLKEDTKAWYAEIPLYSICSLCIMVEDFTSVHHSVLLISIIWERIAMYFLLNVMLVTVLLNRE